MFLRYANIIFDLERAKALKTVHGYSMISVFPIVDDTETGIHVDGREPSSAEKRPRTRSLRSDVLEVVRYR